MRSASNAAGLAADWRHVYVTDAWLQGLVDMVIEADRTAIEGSHFLLDEMGFPPA